MEVPSGKIVVGAELSRLRDRVTYSRCFTDDMHFNHGVKKFQLRVYVPVKVRKVAMFKRFSCPFIFSTINR